MHLDLFTLFHSHSSIQALGFPSYSIWAGINCKHAVTHASPLVSLPPRVLLCYIILFTANY